MEVLRRCAIAGQGCAYLPEMLVSEDLADGRLRTFLEEEGSTQGGLFLVYPHNRHLSAKVRAFVDHTVSFLENRS